MPNLEFFWVRYFFLLLFPLVVWQKNPPTANKYNVILSQSCQYLPFASQYHVANLCELIFDFLLYRQNSKLPSCLKR